MRGLFGELGGLSIEILMALKGRHRERAMVETGPKRKLFKNIQTMGEIINVTFMRIHESSSLGKRGERVWRRMFGQTKIIPQGT